MVIDSSDLTPKAEQQQQQQQQAEDQLKRQNRWDASQRNTENEQPMDTSRPAGK